MTIPFSIEIYPATTPDIATRLDIALVRLMSLGPEYISVTDGAGGCTRGFTSGLVERLKQVGQTVAPHLSAVGTSREEVRSLLEHYRSLGIDRLFALRGDTPSGMGSRGDFAYACDLVRFIREETGNHFQLHVAAYPETHPQAASPAKDLAALKAKQDAGANVAVTQYFFNADAFLHLRDQCAQHGITLPLVPGILPLTRFKKTAQLADARGIELPRWIARKMQSIGDDSSAIRKFGLDVTAALCERLIAEGVPALHFFSLNQASAIENLVERLALSPAKATA